MDAEAIDSSPSHAAGQPSRANRGISLATLAKTVSKVKNAARRAYNRKNIVADDYYFLAFRLGMLCPAYLANTVVISPFLQIRVEKQLNFYVVNCQYGDIEWSIKRKIGAFFKLHAELASKKFGRRDLPSLPDFPLERKETIAVQELKIQAYLIRLIANFTFTNLELDILSFLNISANSFIRQVKPLELSLKAHHLIPPSKKRIFHWSGYNNVYGVIFGSCLCLFPNQWSKEVLMVIQFDQNFKIQFEPNSKLKSTKKLLISNYSNQIHIKLHKHESHLLFSYINHLFHESLYNQYHRHDSFAPVRNGGITFYIDACDYFKSLFTFIEQAKSTIYITDWWCTPELFLLRPWKLNEHSRLDKTILRAAERNVSVYILIFKEINMALPNDSEHTKLTFDGLHRNIHVQRHPDHFSANGSLLWSHHEKLVVIDEEFGFIGGNDLCLGRWSRQQHALLDDPEDIQDQLIPGQDYNNVRIRDFIKVRSKWQDDIIGRDDARMPWHDIHSQVQGESVLDLSFHFVQYWNHAKLTKTKREAVPFLIPPLQRNKMTINNNYVTTQVLRSCSPWSIGQPTESSILSAYLSLIENANNYIYIENQFFISNANTNEYVKNTVAKQLVNRIIRAKKESKIFRVFIIIPLVPGFQGDLNSDQGNTAKLILQFQYAAISKGPNSIYALLQKQGIDANDYLRVFGLRNYAIKNDVAVNEQIYVHSKLMIVDDNKCIIGSANINDRSLIGNRDSEMAVLSEYKSSEYMESMLNVTNPIKQLRIDLWKEHLGEIHSGIKEPQSEEAWGLWAIRANANTNIYRRVFNPYPDDLMTTFKALQDAGDFKVKLTLQIKEELDMIKGHVVEYPIWFLNKEKQIHDTLSMESLAPGEMFL